MSRVHEDRSELPEDVVLRLEEVDVTFEMDRGRSHVLDDVTLDIERGEILGTVGESGSGKSMFASAMLDAVVDPGVLSGEITYNPADGEPVDVLDLSAAELKEFRWEEIAMVFQGAMGSFNPTITVREHFRETLSAHDVSHSTGMERARQLLSDLYLEPERVLDAYPHELSGGMSQRALIALSLVLEPEVLVMDEPTAALDLLMQQSIISLLNDIQRKYDLTIVFITHDLPLVADLADRLAVMYAFEIVELGPAREIITASSHPYTRALINSTPNLDTPVERMRPIDGEAPDPVEAPAGCSYHPRCPMADTACETDDPAMRDVGPDHATACHYADDVDDAVPLTVGEYAVGASEATDQDSDPTGNPSSGESVVEATDLEVHFDQEGDGLLGGLFGNADPVRAVDGVDVSVREEDVVALIGESGCGKTTLGKTLVGLERPTGGRVRYRGQDIWTARENPDEADIPFDRIRRALQIIHQDPGSSLNPNKTVESILRQPLRQDEESLSRADKRARIHAMLERVGMKPAADYAGRYPHQLSGGEKQRVALIRALLVNPDLILADEAVSALDVSLRVDMMDLMLELQEQFGTSYLFISHNLSNARYLTRHAGGRIGIMYLGELVEVGDAEDVLTDPQHPYTKVLMWATADLDPETGGAEQPPVREIDVPDPTDPPSGCAFHTRCPEAREVCTERNPTLTDADTHTETDPGGDGRAVACFRSRGADHDYWDSEELDTDVELDATETRSAADD